MVTTDAGLGVAPLVWLGNGATTASPESVKTEVAKLAYLRNLGAGHLDLSVIPPERLRQLAALARRPAPSALRQMAAERRYPILLAALAVGHTEITDEVVRLFDQALAGTHSRARFKVAQREAELVQADMERLVLPGGILGVVLDDDLDDAAVGSAVRGLGSERLADAARGDDDRLPRDGGHLELMEASFSHVRAFAPHVLAALITRVSRRYAPYVPYGCRALGAFTFRNCEIRRRHSPAGGGLGSAGAAGPVAAGRSDQPAQDVAKAASLSKFKERLDLLRDLDAIGPAELWLEGVPPGKIAHFAGEARVTDVADLRKVTTEDKRLTLIVSLAHTVRTGSAMTW